MKIALEKARQAAISNEVPVGAVLVDGAGSLIASGHNGQEREHDATSHAEIAAIRAGGKRLGTWRLTGCTLYVTLEPCMMCAGAIVAARISRLVFGAPDSKYGAAGSVLNIPAHPSLCADIEVRAGVLEDECREIIKNFFAERRDVKR